MAHREAPDQLMQSAAFVHSSHLECSSRLVAGAAFFGARFTPGTWYQSLDRPPLTPPDWLFGSVWSLLYLVIAVAAFLVWRSPDRSRVRLGLGLWAVQLMLNALWSYLFFGLERPGLALIDITVLLAVIVATTVVFLSIRKLAGLEINVGPGQPL